MGLPLDGVRILDLATVLAAPLSATLCADLGAEVVKAELPGGSDPLRGLAPVVDGQPLAWKVGNRGKKGITLDVRKDAGRALLLRLLSRFDVLVENFRPGTLDRWGLPLPVLLSANPRLVVLRLTGFGQDGPYAGRAGFARIFEAMSGFTHLVGEPGRGPLHMNFPIGDVIAGLFGAFAIAAAIAELRGDPARTGHEVDLSATEALLRLLDPLPAEYERTGVARAGAGNRASYTAPSNMYLTRDGVWVTLVASSNPVFARLAMALEMPELADDPRYATMAARLSHVESLDAIIAGWFAARDYQELAPALEASAVSFSRVYSIADVLHDPHLAARRATVRLDDPDLGSLPAPCTVPRYPGRPMPVPTTGPAPGEHNAEIYGALGLGEAELAALRAEGVI